jgi:hypothetical protein
MRFSLKWILFFIAYVALATVAFGQPERLYCDALWAISILANVFAATLAVFARGQQRAAALAFVLASVTFTLFDLAGAVVFTKNNHPGFYPIADVFLALGLDLYYPETVMRLRAATAIAAVVFGLIGALVGLRAFWLATPQKE